MQPRLCAGEGCEKTYIPTREGKAQAWRDGWFIEKWDGDAYCPEDLPVWVPKEFRKD